MRAINVDTLEWFQITYGVDKQKAILILKPHINNLDIIEAEPVRHGRWIETDYFDAHKVPIYECSVCFKEVADHYIKCHKYCLHCVAKMDLKE